MRFLLKAAFWLTVVILLLPAGETQRAASTTPVGASEAVSAANAAVSDMRQFCLRQPEACAIGSQAAVSFGQKAQAGAKMLYDFLSERLGPSETGSVVKNAEKSAAAVKPSQHTLTPADVVPAWRGPEPRKEAQIRRPA
jgi:uncharacterized protein DUF5330